MPRLPLLTPSALVFSIVSLSFTVGCGKTAGNEEGVEGTGESGGAAFEPIPARGNIALTDVVANQAVDVLISTNGEWVPPQDRNTYVVHSRDTLLRAYWEIPEDWSAREITAVLETRSPGGDEMTYEDTKMIAGPSFPGDLNRGFVFPIVADQFPPGIEFQISLWEAAPGAEDEPESTTLIESPSDGFQLVGAQPEPAELRVVMFPVIYDDGDGCSTDTSVEVTEEQYQTFLDYHHEQYPVQEVTIDFRRDEPIIWDNALNSLAELWSPLQERRSEDNAPPNNYYYALVDVCAGGIGEAAGIAPGLATDTKSAAYERVSSGVWLDGQAYAYHTMVHELGHNHGRAHVFCAGGDAAGTDPTYPHDDGQIGVWGFGIRSFKLHSPTATRDIMTYCDPSWVSDWGWSKAYERVRTLTSWDYEGAPAGSSEPEGEVLIGLIMPNGEEKWWTTEGAREAEHFSSGQQLSFDYGGEVVESPTNVQILDDGSTMITAMVPKPFVAFEGVSRFDANQGQARPLEVDVGARVHYAAE